MDLELLRPLWYSNGFVSNEDCRQSLKLWLTDGNYYINDSPPDLSLFCQSVDDVKKCLSLDAFRFAAHSAQTVYELEKSNAYTKLTSWRMIQTYYAAYFAAHSVLRFFGSSFSHLEAGHVRFLKDRCTSEAGYLPNLPSSYYLISLSPEARSLSFARYSESHKDLWKCFLALLNRISNESLSLRASEVRKQSLSKKFFDLADALISRGRCPSGNWLSLMRNEVNYKSLHGVWFPFEKSTPTFDDLMTSVKDWRDCSSEFGDPNSITNDRERFFITAFMVIDLGLSIAKDYQEISDKPGRRSHEFKRLINLSAAA